MKGMHNAKHYGLKHQTVWVQDDYHEEMPKKKRMERLIEILQTNSSRGSGGEVEVGLADEKVMVFLNSVGLGTWTVLLVHSRELELTPYLSMPKYQLKIGLNI